MIDLLISALVALSGIVFGLLQMSGKKKAQVESKHNEVLAETYRQENRAISKQVDAIAEGETAAKVTKEHAHEPDSLSDLRKTGY